ncbi:major capsid protein [Enterobacter phage 04_vB_Eclo_IJM]|nr:major capsid protein [Enterobacter phage 04_vB_Eclo_IJM]
MKRIIGQLTIARAKLTSNYVPAGDRYFYTTPDNYSAILAAPMPNAASYAALIDPETGNIRNVMGFVVVEVPHLTQGGAGETRGDDGISIASGRNTHSQRPPALPLRLLWTTLLACSSTVLLWVLLSCVTWRWNVTVTSMPRAT